MPRGRAFTGLTRAVFPCKKMAGFEPLISTFVTWYWVTTDS